MKRKYAILNLAHKVLLHFTVVKSFFKTCDVLIFHAEFIEASVDLCHSMLCSRMCIQDMVVCIWRFTNPILGQCGP